MKTLHRNKRKIYLSQIYLVGNLKKYKEPIEVMENWTINTTTGDLTRLGKESYEDGSIRTDLTRKDYYHMGDRLYIMVTPPDIYDPLCKTADFEVSAEPIVTLNEVKVPITKLTGRRGL